MLNINAMQNIAAVNRKSIEQPQNTAQKGAFSQEIENASQRQTTPKTVSAHKTREPEIGDQTDEKKAEDSETNIAAEEAAAPMACILPIIVSENADDAQITPQSSQEMPIQAASTQTVSPVVLAAAESADARAQMLQSETQDSANIQQNTLQPAQVLPTDAKNVPLEPVASQPQPNTQNIPLVDQQAVAQTTAESAAPIEQPTEPIASAQSEAIPLSKVVPLKSEQSIAVKTQLEQAQAAIEAAGDVQPLEAVDAQADHSDQGTLLTKDTPEAVTPFEPKDTVAEGEDSALAFHTVDSDGALPVELKLNVRSAAELQLPQVKEAVAQAIVQNIETLIQNETNHVKIQMKPDVLGGMTIKLSLEHDGIKVQLLTTGKETHAIVNDQIVQLKDALRERGIPVQQMDVIDQSNSEGFAQPFSRQEQQQQNRPKGTLSRNILYKEDAVGISSIYDSMVRTEAIPLGTVEFSA